MIDLVSDLAGDVQVQAEGYGLVDFVGGSSRHDADCPDLFRPEGQQVRRFLPVGEKAG